MNVCTNVIQYILNGKSVCLNCIFVTPYQYRGISSWTEYVHWPLINDSQTLTESSANLFYFSHV